MLFCVACQILLKGANSMLNCAHAELQNSVVPGCYHCCYETGSVLDVDISTKCCHDDPLYGHLLMIPVPRSEGHKFLQSLSSSQKDQQLPNAHSNGLAPVIGNTAITRRWVFGIYSWNSVFNTAV